MMPQRAALNKFISIFRIELEDLEQDINDLLEILEQRKDSQEITNYVYLGNKGVLLNEISCIRELLDTLSSIDAYEYPSVEIMITEVRNMLFDRIRNCGAPEVVHQLVERKFEKVCTYVMTPETPQR
jgi:hypothetical protein